MGHHHRKTRAWSDRRKLLKERQLARCRNPALAGIVERNIDAIETHRREAEASKSFQDQIADVITRFSGSMPFIYIHVAIFAVWIGGNLGVAGIPAFDPFPFGMLTTIVSLEAIFLSAFVLVSQNRQAEIAERRAELDLQINLLTEYEVTRILTLTDKLAERLGVHEKAKGELKELERDIEPEEVLKELENRDAASSSHQAATKTSETPSLKESGS
jgi:uncharacterized membrane protein